MDSSCTQSILSVDLTKCVGEVNKSQIHVVEGISGDKTRTMGEVTVKVVID